MKNSRVDLHLLIKNLTIRYDITVEERKCGIVFYLNVGWDSKGMCVTFSRKKMKTKRFRAWLHILKENYVSLVWGFRLYFTTKHTAIIHEYLTTYFYTINQPNSFKLNVWIAKRIWLFIKIETVCKKNMINSQIVVIRAIVFTD